MTQTGETGEFRIRLSDSQWLDTLIRTYSDALVRFAFCYVRSSAIAEDIMEDALTDVLMKSKKFSDEAQFRAYLYKAARHRCINYLRRHRDTVPLEDVESVLCAGNLEEDAIIRDRNRCVYEAVQALPIQYRQVLMLTYFEGFTPEEVTVIVSRSPKQVYNLLARARESLRKSLEKAGMTYENL